MEEMMLDWIHLSKAYDYLILAQNELQDAGANVPELNLVVSAVGGFRDLVRKAAEEDEPCQEE